MGSPITPSHVRPGHWRALTPGSHPPALSKIGSHAKPSLTERAAPLQASVSCAPTVTCFSGTTSVFSGN